MKDDPTTIADGFGFNPLVNRCSDRKYVRYTDGVRRNDNNVSKKDFPALMCSNSGLIRQLLSDNNGSNLSFRPVTDIRGEFSDGKFLEQQTIRHYRHWRVLHGDA